MGITDRLQARVLLGRAELSLKKGDYSRTLNLVEESLAISEKAAYKKYIGKSLKLKAEVQEKIGNLEEAIENMNKALSLFEEMGTPHLLWQIYHSLGLLLEKHGETQKSREYLEKALKLIEATASGLDDPSLEDTLLSAPSTVAIREAIEKIKSASL
jgi:tetratricopeptide (TPR) repeat protein